ncbi:MAG: CbtB-domain containing protein [Sphingomonas sp.]
MGATTLFADDVFIPVPAGNAIPLGEILPWAVFGTLLALIFLYFVSTEQGAVSLFSGKYVHEFVHDGRHLLGFPCH